MYPYIPHTDQEIKEMLNTIGVANIDDLYVDIPAKSKKLNIPSSSDEFTVFSRMKSLSESNAVIPRENIFLGAGYYAHHIPEVVKFLAGKPEFVTAYTPYQAEVSQGTLQALFEYQTMMCELTGMEVTNSSMYDGASALAEAIMMSYRVKGKSRILISEAVHPEYISVSKTYANPHNIDFNMIELNELGQTDVEAMRSMITEETAAVVVQYPNFFGVIEDLKAVREVVPEDVMLIVVSEPISLSVLESPGKFGADIVVGDGQPLGLPLSYGGPGVGYFATREKYVRKMPGRIIGETKDLEGNTGYVMILQTREQHIRRSRATSNICSNQALCAVTNAIYLSILGPNGLREVAMRSYRNAHYLAEKLENEGFNLVFKGAFFNEFVFRVKNNYDKKWKAVFEKGFLAPLPLQRYYKSLKDCALACATEVNTAKSIELLVKHLGSDER